MLQRYSTPAARAVSGRGVSPDEGVVELVVESQQLGRDVVSGDAAHQGDQPLLHGPTRVRQVLETHADTHTCRLRNWRPAARGKYEHNDRNGDRQMVTYRQN